MKTILFRQLNRVTIRKQLFIVYIPTIFLSTIIIGLFLVYDSTTQLKNNYEHLSELNAQRVKSVLYDTTSTLYNTANQLSIDTQLRQLLTNEFSQDSQAIEAINDYKQLHSIRQFQPAIAKIRIYSTNQTLPNYKDFVQANALVQKTDWFQKAISQPDAFLMTINDEKSLNYLALYKELPLPRSQEKAIVELILDYNYLSNRICNSSYIVQLQLNDDQLFYHDQIQQLGMDSSFVDMDKNTTSFQKKDGQQLLVASNRLKMNNQQDIIHIYSTDPSAYQNLQSNLVKWTMIVLISLISTFIIISLFARFFTNRIRTLQLAVYHASIENYDFFQNISGEDEISQISLDFHKIIQHIKYKEEEIYQARLSKQELLNQQQQMEFNLLASQINPHFLFNTLETIRMMAIRNGNTDVAYAIKLLAKSMRYTLEVHGTELTSLKKEIDAVHVYVKIQRMRFGDRVNFSVQISNEINQDETMLLPLLIQPLVENAISHGLEGLMTDGHIRLTVSKDQGDLLITVQDDGVGITEEKLQELQEKIQHSSHRSTKNIGLANVNYRVKMFYGSGYGLTISSVRNQGTLVQLKIRPYDPIERT